MLTQIKDSFALMLIEVGERKFVVLIPIKVDKKIYWPNKDNLLIGEPQYDGEDHQPTNKNPLYKL